PGMEIIIVLSAFFGALFFTFIFWVLWWSGVTFAISTVFKGQGSFKRTMEIVGYGYLPQVVGIIINSIVAYLYIPAVKVPTLSAAAIQDPQLIQEATRALMHDPAMMALIQITSIISIVFLVLSANIWIFGLKHARMLPLRDAAICVGIPFAGYIIYNLYVLTVM
ncbi:MAG: YIP1 family protein, partial [Methanoregulaceae archaeon]|nr:YIP1 family protein [Methanoregulaceae archaeon]